jgi:hypothetical protein
VEADLAPELWSTTKAPPVRVGVNARLPRKVSDARVLPTPTVSKTGPIPGFGSDGTGRTTSFSEGGRPILLSGEPTLYGWHGLRADSLPGGHAEVVEVRDLARKHNLDLRSYRDRQRVMKLYYAERGKSVRDAMDFDEAMHAHGRDKRVNFAEAKERESAAREVMKMRKDLIPSYGRRDLNLDTSETAMRFAEKAAEQLRLSDVLDPKLRTGDAWRKAAREFPHLCPDYSSRGRR